MALRFRNTDGDEYTRTTNLPATTALTVCCALKLASFPSGGRSLWALGLDASNYIYVSTGGVLTNLNFTVRVGGANGTASRPGVLKLGEWLFIAATRNGATARLYVGPLGSASPLRMGENAAVPAGDFTPDSFTIGDNPDAGAGQELDGELAYVRVWTAELTAAQLAKEREFSSWMTGARSADLHAAYPLSGVATRDLGPNGYTLTAGTAVGAVDPIMPRRRRIVIGKAPAAAAGQPMTRRYAGIPHQRRGGPTFGSGWLH